MTSTLAGLAPARRFGPWAADLDPAERLARLRSLRALARVLAGPRADGLCELLQRAETDPAAVVPAADALDDMNPLDMRRILASYAGLARPVSPARRTSTRGVRACRVPVPTRPGTRPRPRRPALAQPIY